MPDEPFVSRREFDQFSARVSDMGQLSTAPLAVQLAEVIKDVNELKLSFVQRSDAHDRLHEREEARRLSARRWAVATVIAAVAAVDGPMVTILLARR